MSSEMSMSMSMFVSSELNRQMVNVCQEVAIRAVKECGKMYNFDSEDAIRILGLNMIKLSRTKPLSLSVCVSEVKENKATVKASFPLPFNGELNDMYCQALRQNNGLYTQCQIARKGEKPYCKSCEALAEKSSDGIPEYGTISQRMAVDIFEYIDPKGRKPVAYRKIMKKYKLSEEQVLAEASKLNINIVTKHFEMQEEAVKRGRPAAAKKEAKEPKGAKGRPKKEKKVLAIEGEEEDLFASLVADANQVADEVEDAVSEVEEVVNDKEKEEKLAAEKVLATQKKAEEKALAAQKKAEEKAQAAAEKEAKLAAEKAEKEAKKAAEKAEKEAKLAAEKAEKEAKKAAEEEAKKLKAAEKALATQKKEAKKPEKKEEKPAASPDDEEADVVKKIEVDGKKYLKSKKTGIIYDYAEYVKNGDQLVVGQWNETKNKIDFKKAAASDEESEDEIEDDDV